jgi:chromosome segregation ATPase
MLYDTTYYNIHEAAIMAITKEQIFTVADELDAAGQSPTLAAVRKAVGGGSFTTISEAMSEWKAQRIAQSVPSREPVPQALNEKLNELGFDIWSLATSAAQGRLQQEREGLAAARTQMEAEHQEAADLADSMNSELETLQQKLQSLEATLAQERGSVATLREQLQKTNDRAITAEARAGEIEKRADNLNAELERVNLRNAELIQLMTERLSRFTEPK